MLQGFPTTFTTPTLQPTQQLLSLKVLAGAEAEVEETSGGKEWELQVWERGCPLGGARQGCGWGRGTGGADGRNPRRVGNEDGARNGHYWGSAEAQDATILDLRAVLEKTAEKGEKSRRALRIS